MLTKNVHKFITLNALKANKLLPAVTAFTLGRSVFLLLVTALTSLVHGIFHLGLGTVFFVTMTSLTGLGSVSSLVLMMADLTITHSGLMVMMGKVGHLLALIVVIQSRVGRTFVTSKNPGYPNHHYQQGYYTQDSYGFLLQCIHLLS